MIEINTPQIIITVLLSILGLFILFCTLFLVLRIKITIKIEDEFYLYITFFGIRFRILPRPKKKKYRLSKYTLKKIRARDARKEERKRKRALRKANNKKPKKEKEKKKKPEKEQKKKDTKKTDDIEFDLITKDDIPDIINILIDITKAMPGAFFARFHFHTSKLHVIVGSSDAAKTAILTGAISGALYPTFEFLKRHSNLHARGADILIAPDYTAEKIKFNGNIAFSMSILGFMIACLKLCVIATVKVVNFFIDKKRQKNEADDEKSSENKTEEN